MKPISIDSFMVSGLSVRTTNALEASGSGKLASLRARYYAAHPSASESIYGVYYDYQSDASGEYAVTVGTRTNLAVESVVTIKPGSYLEFPASGQMPGAIINAWKSVWEYFASSKVCTRTFETDFEQYNGPTSAAIYIGVKAGR